MFKYSLYVFLVIILASGCKKDDDHYAPPSNTSWFSAYEQQLLGTWYGKLEVHFNPITSQTVYICDDPQSTLTLTDQPWSGIWTLPIFPTWISYNSFGCSYYTNDFAWHADEPFLYFFSTGFHVDYLSSDSLILDMGFSDIRHHMSKSPPLEPSNATFVYEVSFGSPMPADYLSLTYVDQNGDSQTINVGDDWSQVVTQDHPIGTGQYSFSVYLQYNSVYQQEWIDGYTNTAKVTIKDAFGTVVLSTGMNPICIDGGGCTPNMMNSLNLVSYDPWG